MHVRQLFDLNIPTVPRYTLVIIYEDCCSVQCSTNRKSHGTFIKNIYRCNPGCTSTIHFQACSLPMLTASTASRLVVSGARRAVVVAGQCRAVQVIRRTSAVRGIQSIAQTDRVRNNFYFIRLTFSHFFFFFG